MWNLTTHRLTVTLVLKKVRQVNNLTYSGTFVSIKTQEMHASCTWIVDSRRVQAWPEQLCREKYYHLLTSTETNSNRNIHISVLQWRCNIRDGDSTKSGKCVEVVDALIQRRQCWKQSWLSGCWRSICAGTEGCVYVCFVGADISRCATPTQTVSTHCVNGSGGSVDSWQSGGCRQCTDTWGCCTDWWQCSLLTSSSGLCVYSHLSADTTVF